MVCLAATVMVCQQAKLQALKLEDVGVLQEMLADLNYSLELKPDKLLVPFLRESGLDPKEESQIPCSNMV